MISEVGFNDAQRIDVKIVKLRFYLVYILLEIVYW